VENVDVLTIAAHPDDIELTCAGTLIKMVDKGYSVGILDLTQGEMGTRGTPELRAVEAEAARIAIGAAWRERLNFGDSRLTASIENRHALAAKIREARPKTVILPYWEAIKAQEKAEKLKDRPPEQRSRLDGIPGKLPALHEAHQISSRAVRAGFDWPDVEGVFEKLQEEVLELKEVISESGGDGRRERLEDEIGDMLFCMVNIARFLKIDSESALKRANRKFKTRFQYMESELARQGKSLEETSLAEMETLWQKAKTQTPLPT